MARRIRLLSRNTIRQRQQLRLLKGFALLSLVAGVFTYLYIFIHDIHLARAAMAESLKADGRIIKEGYHGRLKIKLNTIISSLDEAVPIALKFKVDPLKNIRYGGQVISNEANDICITASDGGTLLKFIIERYNPQTGEIMVWLYPQTEHQDISKPIYLYYGNAIEAKATKTNPLPEYYKAIWNFNGTFDAHGLKYMFGEFKGVKDEEGLFGFAKSFLSIERSAAVFDAGNSMDFNGSLSLSVWIKPNSTSGEQTLFTNESLNGGCRLFINKSGRVSFKMVNRDGHVTFIDKDMGGRSLVVDEWVHVAAVYNASKKKLSIYINGKVDREKFVSNQYEAGKLIIFGANADLKHGFYNGLMDEFRISNKALSPNQVNDLYIIAKPDSIIAQIMIEDLPANDSPLTLERFTATPVGNTIQVNWTTKNETRLDYLVLERATDTFTCAVVAKLLAKGGMIRYQHYSVFDNAPKIGASYYRLRFLNHNRSCDSSKWQAVYYYPMAYSLKD